MTSTDQITRPQKEIIRPTSVDQRQHISAQVPIVFNKKNPFSHCKEIRAPFGICFFVFLTKI